MLNKFQTMKAILSMNLIILCLVKTFSSQKDICLEMTAFMMAFKPVAPAFYACNMRSMSLQHIGDMPFCSPISMPFFCKRLKQVFALSFTALSLCFEIY